MEDGRETVLVAVVVVAGLLVIAKDEYSLMHLSDQFRARSVQRTYQSITLGCPSPPQGQVSTNIGRDSSDRKKMAAFTTGSSRHALPCCWLPPVVCRAMPICVTCVTVCVTRMSVQQSVPVQKCVEEGFLGLGWCLGLVWVCRGRSAVSGFRVLKALGDGAAALVEWQLQTGRTHQIR